MPGGWSLFEVEATVADYFRMLAEEISGRAYSKTQHRKALAPLLRNRSKTAIERKHMNISAILRELEHPIIDGYKPLGNYQQLLLDAVVARVKTDDVMRALVLSQIEAPVSLPLPARLLDLEVPAPQGTSNRRSVRERGTHPYLSSHALQKVDYLALETRNRDLGLAGEKFVMQFEAERLHAAGAPKLADRIEHIALTHGDGAGFDISSFEVDGRDRLIEVKTTAFGRRTPFFVTRNELASSIAKPDQYHLYRLFQFRRSPHLFTIRGALESVCRIEPVTFIARVA